MGRAKRIEQEGAIYHIISKAVNEENVFKKDEDYKYFLELACNIFIKNQVMLLSFALMKNHYHLLIKTGKANLSEIMQEVNSKYAHHFNSLYMRNGHLFNDRYRSYLIKNDDYFITAFVYINLNPLEANLVKQPEDYKWCSFRYFKERANAPKCLNFQEISRLTGIEIAKIPQFISANASKFNDYKKEVKEYNSERETKKIKKIFLEINSKYSDVANKKELKYLIIYALYLRHYRLLDISSALGIHYQTIASIRNKAEKRSLSDSIFNEWLEKISKDF